MLSNSETLMPRPHPVRWRAYRAWRMAWWAYMPVAMSPAETPTRAGWSAVPVTLHSPDSAWISRSYAFMSRYGPSSP